MSVIEAPITPEIDPLELIPVQPEEPDVVRNLRRAKALISDPANWTKHDRRRLNSNFTYRYCALGAIAYVKTGDAYGDVYPEATYVKSVVRRANLDIALYNDRAGTTHADIMALFDKAIKLALRG